MTLTTASATIPTMLPPCKIQRINIHRINECPSAQTWQYVPGQSTAVNHQLALIQTVVKDILSEQYTFVLANHYTTTTIVATYHRQSQLLHFASTYTPSFADYDLYVFAESKHLPQALERVSMEDFSERIMRRLADIQICKIACEYLYGPESLRHQIYIPKCGPQFSPWAYYNSHLLSLTTQIRKNASILSCQGFQPNESATQITATSHSITVEKNLTISDYSHLLERFSWIFRGMPSFSRNNEIEKDAPELSLWSSFKTISTQATTEKLNAHFYRLLESYFNGTAPFVFSFQHNDLFYNTSDVSLISGAAVTQTWSGPVQAEEIAFLLKSMHKSPQEFLQHLSTVEICYVVDGIKHQKPFIHMLKGKMDTPEGPFFLYNCSWQQNIDEYFTVVEDAFRTVLQKRLLQPGDERNLQLPWVTGSESAYNHTYIGQTHTLFGDELYFSSTQEIEIFDLLRYIPTKPKKIYVYVVKKGFGQPTREATSQIRNSAAVFFDLNAPLWSKIQSVFQRKNPNCTPEVLRSYLQNKKIVFVYAISHTAKTKGSLQREITKRSVLTSDDLRNHGIQSPDGIIQTLKEEGYLTEAGRVTNKLLTTTNVDFSTTLKDKIKIKECQEARNTVLHLTQRVFDSQIAREELVTISQELKQKNFGFKICEIPTREPELSLDLSTLHL